ncbi:MAG: LamG-like jellyroll fold domain-containing protein [Verrucomicrobiaceae bacterium]
MFFLVSFRGFCEEPVRLEGAVHNVERQRIAVDQGLPNKMEVSVTRLGKKRTISLKKHSHRGENFRLLLQGEDGELRECFDCPVGSYLGKINGSPDDHVNAVRTEAGLKITVVEAGGITWIAEPAPGAEKGSNEYVIYEEGSEDHLLSCATCAAQHAGTAEKDGLVHGHDGEASAKVTKDFALPTTVTVKQAEMGFDFDYTYYQKYGSSTANVMAAIDERMFAINRIWISDVLCEHVVGTVVIRTSAATDPYQGESNSSALLSRFRGIWNGADRPSSTHDVAHCGFGKGIGVTGLAYVGTIGTSNKYNIATAGTSQGLWRGGLLHELGHSWTLGHGDGGDIDDFTPWGDTMSPGMIGGFRERANSREVEKMLAHRNSRGNGVLVDLGSYTVEANPDHSDVSQGAYCPLDRFNALIGGSALDLDVLKNDFDANNDSLHIESLKVNNVTTATTTKGGTIEVVHGVGPGGRDVVRYTPPGNASAGRDAFHYFVRDSAGSGSWGNVQVELAANPLVTVDLSKEKYDYDFGTFDSPVRAGWSQISPETNGDIFWSLKPQAHYRTPAGGINEINIDVVQDSREITLSHKISPGTWNVTLNMGDAEFAHDNMQVAAEGIVFDDDVDHGVAEFPYVTFQVVVADGQLDITFSDNGGSDPNWTVTRMTLTKASNETNVDTDSDGIDDGWEHRFFSNLTSASATSNSDGDDLTDLQEYTAGTDPTLADTDGEGLSDSDEVNVYASDPNDRDSDGDGFQDDVEVEFESNPNDSGSLPVIPGLLAYYSFDEGAGDTATDYASLDGSQNAVQNQGTITWTSSGQQIGEGSLDLGGSASLGAANAIPESATALTMSAWIKLKSDGAYKGVYSGRNTSNWGLNVREQVFEGRIDNVGGGSAGKKSPDGSVTATSGWHHVAITWETDGVTGSSKTYLDGVVVVASSGPTSYVAPDLGYFIGDDPCCNNRELNGLIDDLVVFERALSEEEMAEVYQVGQEGLQVFSALEKPDPVDVGPTEIKVTFLGLFPTGSFGIRWDSADGPAFYDVETLEHSVSGDVSSPLEWVVIAEDIPNGGALTTFFHANAQQSDRKRVYRVVGRDAP